MRLLNPSSASAGLKLVIITTKAYRFITTKPFFGFGWIETLKLVIDNNLEYILLNPSSASAGLKLRHRLSA